MAKSLKQTRMVCKQGPHHRLRDSPLKCILYRVVHIDKDSREPWSRTTFEIEVNKDEGEYKCICRKFEHMGVLCAHIFKVTVHTGCTKIPNKYIMKRWTRRARNGTGTQIDSMKKDICNTKSRTHRHALLHQKCMEVSWRGDQSIETFNIAMNYLSMALKNIRLIDRQIGSKDDLQLHGVPLGAQSNTTKRTIVTEVEVAGDNQVVDHGTKPDEVVGSIEIQPPTKRAKRGRPRSTRIPNLSDTGGKKKRTCGFCGKKGHNRNGCELNPINVGKTKQERVCGTCGLSGHYSSTCGEDSTTELYEE